MTEIIDRIKQELSIGWAWRHLNLPGKPGKDCRSPFRQDKSPSFTIFVGDDGFERWHDHGITEGGDVIDFWAKARGIPLPEAIHELSQYLAGNWEKIDAPTTYSASGEKQASEIRWPADLRAPTEFECRALGILRGLNPGAFELAGLLGTLKVGTMFGEPVWILTDQRRIGAEARRFDGKGFVTAKGEVKSFALVGSHKWWPVGLQTINSDLDALVNILLVEGLPDYFAGLSLAIDSAFNFRVAAMLGASASIGWAVAPYVEARTIIIIPHNDQTGDRAADRWAQQLVLGGAKSVDIKPLDAGQFDDLNTFVSRNPPESVIQDLLKEF